MEDKMSSETKQKDKSSEIVKISRECISCKNILPNDLDKGICPHCGVRNR